MQLDPTQLQALLDAIAANQTAGALFGQHVVAWLAGISLLLSTVLFATTAHVWAEMMRHS